MGLENQLVCLVPGGKAGYSFQVMAGEAVREIAGHPGVEDRVAVVGRDVDSGL